MNHPITSTSFWQRLALGVILLLAVFLNFGNIGIEGYANLYYAAGVYSMGQNWHAFFFNSFDPAGFVTIDKPPLGLWLQVLSTKIFGFQGWALILPQALSNVLSVALIYYLVRRIFGVNAGLLAALTLALTPISVAASRNNTMDSVLVLTLLLAVWAVTLAAERGQLRWLVLSGLLLGLGFEIKMLQAYMVLPAIYLAYFFTAPTTWWRRVWHLAVASLLIAVVSLAWPLAVDLTSAENRPYVGSSTNNTVMELIAGHNGAKRLGQLAGLVGVQVGDGPGARPLPQGNLPPRGANPPVNPPPGNRPPGQPLPGDGQPPGGNPAGQPASGFLANETGEPGPFRLLNHRLAGQISWFIPLALLLIPLILLVRRLIPDYPVTGLASLQFVLLWAGWLIPQVIFFSYAGLFHRYYLMMLGPAIAALVGAGFKVLIDVNHLGGWQRGWLLTVGLVVAITQVSIIAAFPEFAMWLIPLLFLLTGIFLLFRFLFRHRQRFAAGISLLLLVPLFLAPFIWSLIGVIYGVHTGLPYAGPEILENANFSWASASNLSDASGLAGYLRQNQGEAVYILATQSSMQAAPLILLTGQPVMALGGFSGGDPILSVDDFKQMVAEGQVRFVLLQDQAQPNSMPGGPASQGNNRQPQNPAPNAPRQSEIIQWAAQNCTPVEGFPLLDCATKP